MDSVSLSHPMKPSRARTVDYVTLEETRVPDPLWHFRMAVRWPSEVGPPALAAPEPGAPQRLLWLRREGGGAPMTDIEVEGHALVREVDAADYLDAYLDREGMTVVSRQPIKLRGGMVGDAVARWAVSGEDYAGRFFASKWGPRLFLLSMRARLEDYERTAEDFFTTLSTFEAIDDSLGLLAEHVKEVTDTTPVPWRAVIPEAWTLMRTQKEESIGSFQATQTRGFDINTVDGKLSFAVAARSVAARPRDAATMFLRALKANGIQPAGEDFEQEQPDQPFERSWLLTTGCSQGERRGEVRCRVMMHPKLWVVAGVVGPAREDDRASWMENKRALDVVTSTLEVK